MAEEKQNDTEEKSEKSGLRPAQVIAAALAAVTAAFLGSFLGVYGTVLGAGVVSVVTTVGSEIYLRSLQTTKAATKKAKALAVAITDTRAGQTRTGPALSVSEQPTVRLPVPGEDKDKTVYLAKPDTPAAGQRTWWRRRWPLVLATSVAAFVIGMFVVTGFELVSGSSLSGQGASTVGELVGDRLNQPGDQEQPTQQPSTPAQQQDQPTAPPATTTETSVPPETTAPTGSAEQQPTSESSRPSETTSVAPTSEPSPTTGAGDEVTPSARP
ncbi:hypothetical protein ABZ863_11250 [Saccharomonospora sp. NPDC046836]|uniref:hypothetical protein n=1 Tax=Saccharomonospora sp. NPDC046836 TaxID=3156921 RepID=UPI0033D49ACA